MLDLNSIYLVPHCGQCVLIAAVLEYLGNNVMVNTNGRKINSKCELLLRPGCHDEIVR
jgi:hypothetical protein